MTNAALAGGPSRGKQVLREGEVLARRRSADVREDNGLNVGQPEASGGQHACWPTMSIVDKK